MFPGGPETKSVDDQMNSSATLAIFTRSTKSIVALWIGIALTSLNCVMTQEQFEAEHWDVTKKGPIPTFKR